MIRCTIELLPAGDESRARTIGLIEIANTAVLPGNFGEYAVVLTRTPPFTGALRLAWRRGRVGSEGGETLDQVQPGEDEEIIVATVSGHHRTRRGVYDLLYRALKACGLEQRNRDVASPSGVVRQSIAVHEEPVRP